MANGPGFKQNSVARKLKSSHWNSISKTNAAVVPYYLSDHGRWKSCWPSGCPSVAVTTENQAASTSANTTSTEKISGNLSSLPANARSCFSGSKTTLFGVHWSDFETKLTNRKMQTTNFEQVSDGKWKVAEASVHANYNGFAVDAPTHWVADDFSVARCRRWIMLPSGRLMSFWPATDFASTWMSDQCNQHSQFKLKQTSIWIIRWPEPQVGTRGHDSGNWINKLC